MTQLISDATMTSTSTPTADERWLAVAAHGSILLTFFIAVTTGGIGVLAAMLVPFFIWVVYRDRSDYVAYHALQATLYQLALLVGFMTLVGAVTALLVLLWLITAVLSIIIVGLILVPVMIVLTVLAATAMAAYGLAGLGYGLLAAWQVFDQADFRYPYLADWLDKRLAG